MARPSVLADVSDAGEIECVAVDVPARHQQVLVAVDQPRSETTTEDRAVPAEPVVDMAGVHRAQTLHRFGQRSIRTLEQQMKMRRHQAIGVGDDAESLEDVGEPLTELDAVGVVAECRPTIDGTVHDVMERLGKVRSQGS